MIDRLEFEDATISLWSSPDMVALKLISQALGRQMAKYIPKSCCHVKNHGGLKKAVRQTYEALPQYHYVMRSDVQGYHASICFDVLMGIIESYVTHPILLTLVRKACLRTETCGGVFYDYDKKGMPKGSPLSPILGAVALIPLDKAMGKIKGVFYQCFMDGQKILPSKETIRRFFERATTLYENPQSGNNHVPQKRKFPRRRRHTPKTATPRDISEYLVSEAAPTNAYLEGVLQNLLALAGRSPDTLAAMRRRFGLWKSWLKCGLSTIEDFATSVQNFLPCMFSCSMQEAAVPAMGTVVVG